MPFDHFGVIAPIFSRVGYSSLETMLEQAQGAGKEDGQV